MAWGLAEGHHHLISDGWQVSSLFHASVEVILALSFVLCAIISVTTTRLIKSSRLFPPKCLSCNIQHHHPRHHQGRTNGDSHVDGHQKLEDSCCSFDHVHSSCDCSDRIDGTTVAAARPPSRGTRRAAKRKFAKMFPNDSRGGSRSQFGSGNLAHGFTGRATLSITEGEGPVAEERSLQQTDGSSRLFLSDSSEAQHQERFGPEGSVRVSSQESFSYNRRRDSPGGLSRGAEVSRNRAKLSIDADFLWGQSTPEWCDSQAYSPAVGNGKKMEEEEQQGEAGRGDDPEIGAMELREALQEEKEALAAVYLELEEERSAASSAAHEAMAMITRLQEEKAAIQMEARQYRRMAEEKHHYDQESMAMLQEILVRREEEVYALEEEVSMYKNKLLSLGMHELPDLRAGRGRGRGSDVLVIEVETLSLQGSEDWKNNRDRGDEEFLAEIKEWLDQAREKVLLGPERIEELQVPCGSISNLLLSDNRRNNSLESLSSVAMDDSERNPSFAIDGLEAHRNGVANEELEAHRDEFMNDELDTQRNEIANEGTHNRDTIAAGYESFQGMMESLRREPSLRDEESLQTLHRIEENFHMRSSQGEVRRSGDELRQIWKNTLRSFENDEQENTESHGTGPREAELRTETPITAVQPITTSNTSDQNEGTDLSPADADSLGEKRISVLEYVSKFEEQLHQLYNRKPPLSTKPGPFTTLEPLPESPPESKGESSESVDTDKSKKPHWARLRKLAPGGRSANPDAERDRFVVRGETTPCSERATRAQQATLERSADLEEGSSQDGSSIVHDVYEVQHDNGESGPPTEASSQGGNPKRFSHDIKPYLSSTVNELIPGQFTNSHSSLCVAHYLFDSGRPNFPAGNSPEEHEANGKGRPEQDGSADHFRLGVKELGMSTADRWPEGCLGVSLGSNGCPLQSPSGEATDPPMEDLVEQLTNRLQAMERDRQMMEGTIASLKRENKEMKIVHEIAQPLREQTAVHNTGTWPTGDPASVSTIKGMLSLDSLRHSVKSQLSKLAQLFQGNGDPGGSQGDRHVGLFRLLHNLPRSKQQRPIERARSLTAMYATDYCPVDAQFQPSTSTLNTLLSHRSWPKDAKERSGTALSGWDP